MSFRFRAVACFLALAGSCLGAEGLTPIELLEERGLKKEGKFFILPAEGALLKKIKALQPDSNEVAEKFEIWAGMVQNEQEFQALTAQAIELKAQLNTQLQFIARMPQASALDRGLKNDAQQIAGETDQNLQITNRERALRESRRVAPQRMDKAQEDFKEVYKGFLRKSEDLLPDWQKIKDDYAPIALDTSIKAFLKAYNDQTKANIKLGPSEKIKKAIGDVKAFELKYSQTPNYTKPSSATSRKKSGRKSDLRSRPAA